MNGPRPGARRAIVARPPRAPRSIFRPSARTGVKPWLDYHFGAWPAQDTTGKRGELCEGGRRLPRLWRAHGSAGRDGARSVRRQRDRRIAAPAARRGAQAGRGRDRRARRVQGIRHRAWQRRPGARRARLARARHARHRRGAREDGGGRRTHACLQGDRLSGDAARYRSATHRPLRRERGRLLVGARRVCRARAHPRRRGAGRPRPRLFPGRLAAQILGHGRVSVRPEGGAHVRLRLQGGRGRRVPEQARVILAADARHPLKWSRRRRCWW